MISSSSSSSSSRPARGGWSLALLASLTLLACRGARPVPTPTVAEVTPGERGAGSTTIEVVAPPGAPALPPAIRPPTAAQPEAVPPAPAPATAEATPPPVAAPAPTSAKVAPPAAPPASGPTATVAPPAAQGAAPTATPTATPAPTPPGPRPSPVGPRIALFPLTNRSGGAAATKAVTALLREKLLRRGIQLAAEEDVMKVLAEKRVRYTGGIDIEIADALRQEVGVEGVLIVDLEVYLPGPPCKFGLTARLVSTLGEPVIHWADGIARSGVDRPGLLGLGVIPNIEKLREVVLDQVADSLVASFTNARRVVPCPDWSGRDPDRMFRSAIADDPDRRSIAVLPFVNDTGRRDAGEVTALRLLAPLVNSGLLEVVEPGVVRREMLSYRLGAGGGISLDDARVILELLNSDLVLSGTVRTFEDAAGSSGAPRVDFSVWVLDRKTGELVWSSTASAEGDDGVFFFGLGKVTTASALACTVAKQTVGRILEDRKPRPHPIGEPAPPAPVPDAGKSQDAAPVPSQAPEAPGPAAPETNPAPAGPAPETPAASTRPTGDAGFAQPPAGGARSASP